MECGKTAFISSRALADLTGFSDALVRRDLSYFGRFGVLGRGYPVPELREKISDILGINRKWKIALIGLGNLGSALLRYREFKKQGFEIVAVFDSDPGKVGKSKGGIVVRHVDDLQKAVEKELMEMAIIAVPAEAAKDVIDKVIESGIRAILNFAPVKVDVKKNVSLVNIDFSIELERLSCLVTNKLKI